MENFSKKDIEGAIDNYNDFGNNFSNYLVSPAGYLKKYEPKHQMNPDANPYKTIAGGLPHDSRAK